MSVDRGSALILMPAVVLVVLILAAISVDSAVEYLGHQELVDFAAGAADQIAARALDRDAFYGGAGRLAIKPDVANFIAREEAGASNGGGLTITGAYAVVTGNGRTVTVYATGTVREVFAPAVGGRRLVVLRASSTATIQGVRVR